MVTFAALIFIVITAPLWLPIAGVLIGVGIIVIPIILILGVFII